jgi:lysophospholipase L1-like esterase
MNPIWEEEIQSIEKIHHGLKSVDCLFIGSSSIVLWTTLKQDFKAYSVVKAGFGGSRIQDSIDYFDRLVMPYDPKLVIMFSGTNDINGDSDSAPAEYVLEKVEEFYTLLHKHLPHTKFFYISLTPTPSRFHVLTEVLKANRLIKHLAKEKSFTFIDLQQEFLDEGKPRPEYFTEDDLHLNDLGYKKWVSVIRPIVNQAMRDHCL